MKTFVIIVLLGQWDITPDCVVVAWDIAPVVTVCQCGCGKTNCFCNVASKSCTPKPAVKASAEAMKAEPAVEKPVVTMWSMDNCGPCVSQKDALKDCTTFTLVIRKDVTAGSPRLRPTLTMQGRQNLEGFHTRATVERWVAGK
jgi:hypothetical protein